MKQAIFAAATATILGASACSDQPVNPGAEHQQQDHARHGTSDSVSRQPTGEMQRIMDEMMTDMHSAKPSGNPDRDFAAMMISHHRGAVEMARAELASGTDSGIRRLAEDIIAAQEREIAEMQRIMVALPGGDVKANGAAYDALMGSMSGMMSSHPVPSGNPDKDFVQAMIPHHEGAVEMAKVELQYGRDEKLRAMAQKMVDDQTREIAQMKDWLQSTP